MSYSWLCARATRTQGCTSPANCANFARPTLTPVRHRNLRQQAVRCYCTLEQTAVHIGNTPFGRGLLSKEDLPNRTQLLSVPFEQLLLLPEKLEGSFDTVHAKYLTAHAYIPDKLRRFVEGKLLQVLAIASYDSEQLVTS